MPDIAEITEYTKKVLEEKGWQLGEAGRLLLPPPVEQPEFFPGFGQELQQLGVAQRRAEQRAMAAEQARAGLARRFKFAAPFELPRAGERIFPIFPFLSFRLTDVAVYEQQIEEAQVELDLSLQELKSIRWRQEVMISLPNYLSIPDYKIQRSEDVLNYIPNDALRPDDNIWLTNLYDRMKHLSNVLPEGFDGDTWEAQSKVLNEVLTAPKLELKGVHNLTVDEIAKSFAFGVAELPRNMTEEGVRDILAQIELQDEEIDSAKDWLTERANAWAIESDRLNLIRAGALQAEAPSLTPWEFTKLMVTQPMMATMEMLDKYFNMLPRPLASAAIIGTHRLFKTSEDTYAAELERQFTLYRSQGESNWASLAMAFNEWDAPWYAKIATEAAFDPISYIGFGLITGIGGKLGGVARGGRMANRGSRIGNLIIDFEQGFMAGADLTFQGGMWLAKQPIKGAFWTLGAGYQIPRTATTLARNFARKGFMDFKAVLDRAFPDVSSMKGLTAKDLRDTAEACIKQTMDNPYEGHNLMNKAGAGLLEFNYLDDVAAKKILEPIRTPIYGPAGEVISEAAEVTMDTARLAHFNNEVLNMFSGQGERVTAGKIIADLGVEATEEAVEKMAAKLSTLKDKVAKDSLAALKGDVPEDIMLNLFNRMEGIRYSNLHSPLTEHMTQAGRSVSAFVRNMDNILYSTQLVALERRVVMPVARWNLLFLNFGPFNFFENMQRSFLGGAEVLYPRAYGGVAETNRLFKGLANAPYELHMFERGEARLAQAIIDPKTGRTAVFKGGNIPFVTKEVTIPERIPFLGGKTIGKKMNIAGKDFQLGSFQDQYDMWAHLNSTQVSYDYQVHYMKALTEVAPDDMRAISQVLDNHRAELDNITAFTKGDAKDLERVILADSTVGSAEVRAHADIDVLTMERRQISKELGKTFDRATEVRMITKNGIRDEVLDGSIFKNIDDRVAAFIEAERELSLVSLQNQIDVLKSEADAFLANPPRNIDEFLGDMQSITSMIEGTGERIHDYRRLTELRKAKLSPADFDDFEVGSAKLLAEFMDTSEEQLVRMMNQIVENAKGAPGATGINVFRGAPSPERAARDFPGVFVSRSRAQAAQYGDVSEFVITGKQNILDVGSSEVTSLLDEYTSVVGKGAADLKAAQTGELSDSLFLFPEPEWVGILKRRGYTATSFGEDIFVLDPTSVVSPTPMMSDIQLARLTDLDNISRLELNNILATRNKIAEIESVIPRTAKRRRDNRFWQQQRTQKASIWDEYDTNSRRFKDLRLRASRNFLQSVDKPIYVPDFIPDIVDELTPSHLAYLFGATGDDLYRGLTRVSHHITIHPREDFILLARNQADAYASKFNKVAADIGFTDEAIGDVYDQLWRNLGIEPTTLTPDSPTVMQMEEIRQELHRLHAAYKLPSVKANPSGDYRAVLWQGELHRVSRAGQHTEVISPLAGPRSSVVEGLTSGKAGYITFNYKKAGEMAVQTDRNLLSHADMSSLHELAAKEGQTTIVFSKKPMGPIELVEPIQVVSAPDVVKWRQYVNGVADDLDNLPMYAERVVPEADIGLGERIIEEAEFERLIEERARELAVQEGYTMEQARKLVTVPRRRDVMVDPEEINRIRSQVDKIAQETKANGDTLRDVTDIWQLEAHNDELQTIGRVAQGSPEYTQGIRKILNENYPSGYIRIYRGQGGALKPGEALEREFTNVTSRRSTAVDFQKSWVDRTGKELAPEIDDILIKVDDVLAIGSVIESELVIPSSVLKSRIEGPLRAPTAVRPQWWSNKEQAMTLARERHALAYPTYDNANIIDESMRAVFPFWNYELFRWRWIPRTWMRTPGTMTGLARWMNYTDQGYVPLPGTDLQLNPLRGSVWMGGLRSFYLKDFPEYYDQFPGMEQIDYIGRAGFFPGVHVMAPIVAFGALAGKPEWGELAPAWVRTGLSGLRAMSPEHIGKVLDIVYPDRFRDFQTMLTLGEEGYDADAIWRKKKQGITLTPEEEKLWLRAENRANGIKGILMQQTGIFRIRPQEYTQIRESMRLAIEDATGVPVAVQEQIDRMYPVTGKRFSDYYSLDVLQQKLLYEFESYRRWQGVTTPLYPSSWQLLDVKIRDYYEELDKVYNEARYEGVYEDGVTVRPSIVEANRQFISDEIGPDQWMGLRSDIQSGLGEAGRILGESPAYKDVPKTFDERAEMLEERGIPTPTQGPDQELLYYYYELRPEYKYSWESERMEMDFETYYAKIDILLESLDAAHRERLIQRIQADWTPMERLYWNVSREHLRPYRNLRDIVLREYDEEQVKHIRRFEVARGTEREELQEIIGPDGLKLISGFNKRLREARQRFRILDPLTDAWLNFFGRTDTLMSKEAEQMYEDLRKQYLTPDMIGSR